MEPISTILTLKLGAFLAHAVFHGAGAGIVSGVMSRSLTHGFKNAGAQPKAPPEVVVETVKEVGATYLVMRRRQKKGLARGRKRITADLVIGEENAFHTLLEISGLTPEEIKIQDLTYEKIRNPSVLCDYLARMTGCEYLAGECDPDTQRARKAMVHKPELQMSRAA